MIMDLIVIYSWKYEKLIWIGTPWLIIYNFFSMIEKELINVNKMKMRAKKSYTIIENNFSSNNNINKSNGYLPESLWCGGGWFVCWEFCGFCDDILGICGAGQLSWGGGGWFIFTGCICDGWRYWWCDGCWCIILLLFFTIFLL